MQSILLTFSKVFANDKIVPIVINGITLRNIGETDLKALTIILFLIYSPGLPLNSVIACLAAVFNEW